jgi:hypothetical protein
MSETERDLEFDWINQIIEQVRFANKICKHFHSRLVVRKFCDCYPNCYADTDQESKQRKKKEVIAA